MDLHDSFYQLCVHHVSLCQLRSRHVETAWRDMTLRGHTTRCKHKEGVRVLHIQTVEPETKNTFSYRSPEMRIQFLSGEGAAARLTKTKDWLNCMKLYNSRVFDGKFERLYWAGPPAVKFSSARCSCFFAARIQQFKDTKPYKTLSHTNLFSLNIQNHLEMCKAMDPSK